MVYNNLTRRAVCFSCLPNSTVMMADVHVPTGVDVFLDSLAAFHDDTLRMRRGTMMVMLPWSQTEPYVALQAFHFGATKFLVFMCVGVTRSFPVTQDSSVINLPSFAGPPAVCMFRGNESESFLLDVLQHNGAELVVTKNDPAVVLHNAHRLSDDQRVQRRWSTRTDQDILRLEKPTMYGER